jgi:superfamily II DNA or RNA helicase
VKILEQHRGARTLVFHEYKTDAEAILAALRRRGHGATIYHSGVADGLRRDNLRLFRRGQFDVLVTCRALDEGINVPEVQVAIIASATASSRQRIQRLGRVLRPAPRKEHALVFTLYATKPEEERLIVEARKLTSARSIKWQRLRIK